VGQMKIPAMDGRRKGVSRRWINEENGSSNKRGWSTNWLYRTSKWGKLNEAEVWRLPLRLMEELLGEPMREQDYYVTVNGVTNALKIDYHPPNKTFLPTWIVWVTEEMAIEVSEEREW